MTATFSTFCGMIVSETRDGVERDYMPDTLGSTAALLDENQDMTDAWEYYPYGEVAARTGTHQTDLTFVGMLGYFKDIVDKLFYVRARHLRADLARWLTVDPLWPSSSAYCYASSSPIDLIDPSGLIAACSGSGPGCHVGFADTWFCKVRCWSRGEVYVNTVCRILVRIPFVCLLCKRDCICSPRVVPAPFPYVCTKSQGGKTQAQYCRECSKDCDSKCLKAGRGFVWCATFCAVRQGNCNAGKRKPWFF